ncbi:MAG: zinc ribbon domain-containing protein [Actinobacteria bacterium]|nr:zinc ribbon domain-containing protein [Actinomycetota bacterium]
MQNVFEMLIQVILALSVVAFVGYPLLKGAQAGEDEEQPLSVEFEDLLRRKESTYSALKELEFDFKMGKLSDRDYGEIDARYREDALEILEAIEEAEKGPSSVGSGAKRRAKSTGRQAESRPSASPRPKPAKATTIGRTAATVTCADCGRENPPGSRFCASCGVDLEEAPTGAGAVGSDQLVCDECGRDVAADHRFCAGCGAEVEA